MTLTPQNVVVWHGKTPAEHKALLDAWAAKKFRTLSLSLYGSPSAPFYAAVMVKRPAVIAESQFGPLDQVGMQQAFDGMVENGRGPYILTATGPASEPIFAGCFTPMASIPLTRLNLTADEFAVHCGEEQGKGNILIWADVFGSSADMRYAAIWGPNPIRQAWNCDAIDDSGGALQSRYLAMRSIWARPAHVSVTPSGGCLELFVDSTVGTWFSKVDMSAEEFQQEFNKQKAKGLQPVRVSAQTRWPNENRYAAIFASREETDPRVFRAQGPRNVPDIDSAMETYIKDHNLRGAALAVIRGTELVYAKAYTWAEAAPTYPDLLPTTLFRQASCSKMFTGAAMWRLMQQRPQDVQLETTMQSILNLKQHDGSAPKDSHYGDIRVQHLLESISGLDQGMIWDAQKAAAAFNKNLPATPEQLARYSTSFDLTALPGTTTNVVYGNYDYFLLSQVIAKLVGTTTFEDALTQLVLSPLHCVRTRGSRSLINAQASDEARNHMRVYQPGKNHTYPLELAQSVKTPDMPLVGRQYGGWDMELLDGCGGLSAAVVDMARLAAMFSCRTGNPVLTAQSIDKLFAAAANATSSYSGPDFHGFHGFDGAMINDKANHVYSANKGGWLPGQGTIISFTTTGFGYVIAQNGNRTPGVTTDWLKPISGIAPSQTWPAKDLFHDYGMPTLLQQPIKIVVPKAVKAQTAAAVEELVQASMAPPHAHTVPKRIVPTPPPPVPVR